jgi:hypothetical protein
MGMYLGPSCPDCPSFEELSTADVDAQIHKVMDLRVNLNPRVSPIPLRRGIASARVCMLGLVSVAFTILSFHCARDLAQGRGGGCSEPRDANSPEDAAKQKAKHASSEETWAWRERERNWCAAKQVAKR